MKEYCLEGEGRRENSLLWPVGAASLCFGTKLKACDGGLKYMFAWNG
jgi:hypothetical protein